MSINYKGRNCDNGEREVVISEGLLVGKRENKDGSQVVVRGKRNEIVRVEEKVL